MMYLKVAETLTKSTMCLYLQYCSEWASLVAQKVKCLPAIRETQVWSLGWEDPLEKEMANQSNTLTGKIPWTRSLVGYSPWSHKVRHDWVTSLSLLFRVTVFSGRFSNDLPKNLLSSSYLTKAKSMHVLNLVDQKAFLLIGI